jgi:hypothetical protein
MSWLERLKNQQAFVQRPTKTTETVFVVSVGTSAGHLKKKGDAVDAANDPVPDPDWYCWPRSSAMNGREINAFMARLARFSDMGLGLEVAEAIADRLVVRDRDADDRSVCLECTHLRRERRCANWEHAGVAVRASAAQLPAEFVSLLQRCNGFSQAITKVKHERSHHGQT